MFFGENATPLRVSAVGSFGVPPVNNRLACVLLDEDGGFELVAVGDVGAGIAEQGDRRACSRPGCGARYRVGCLSTGPLSFKVAIEESNPSTGVLRGIPVFAGSTIRDHSEGGSTLRVHGLLCHTQDTQSTLRNGNRYLLWTVRQIGHRTWKIYRLSRLKPSFYGFARQTSPIFSAFCLR